MGAGDILVGMEMSQGFPGNTTGKEPICQCRGCKKLKFHPWVRKVPWKRTGQPAPVFSPGKSHAQRSLAGYSAQGCKSIEHDLRTSQQQSCRKLVTLQMILVHRRINEFCPVETIDCCPVVIDQF